MNATMNTQSTTQDNTQVAPQLPTKKQPKQPRQPREWKRSKAFIKNVLEWEWTKQVLYWLIISAGTMSDLVFLIASIWMSLNASIHPIIKSTIGDDLAKNINYMATMAYVALPELIVSLAVITVIGHIKTFLYTRSVWAGIWMVLFGVPTVVFMSLSLVTIGNSVISSGDFILPPFWVATRALAGFIFAFASLVYLRIGREQEKERLQTRDAMIANLKREMNDTIGELFETSGRISREQEEKYTQDTAALKAEISRLNQIIEAQRGAIDANNRQLSAIKQASNSSDEMALQAYSDEAVKWLTSEDKSVLVSEIVRVTGLDVRKVNNAIAKGKLQTTTRNKQKVLLSSLIPWLRELGETPGNISAIHIVNS